MHSRIVFPLPSFRVRVVGRLLICQRVLLVRFDAFLPSFHEHVSSRECLSSLFFRHPKTNVDIYLAENKNDLRKEISNRHV